MLRTILLRLLDTYFRHRFLYLLPIVITASLGVVYFLNQERLYISSGLIFTDQTSLLSSLTSLQAEGFSWNTPAQDTSNQISDLIRTDAFIRAIIGATDLEEHMSQGQAVVRETITEVRPKIWASVAGTNQVRISAANSDPQIAYQLAQATIDTYLRWKINLDRADSVTAGDFFQELIERYYTDVEESRQALRNYLQENPEPVRGSRLEFEELDIQNLQAELDLASTRLAQALSKAEDARLAEAQVESNIHQKYTVVDAPNLPDKPAISRRQLAMNAAVFLAVGVLLTGTAVIGATVIERSFRIPGDVRQVLDLPLLAVVPELPAQKKRFRIWARKKAAPAKTSEISRDELGSQPGLPQPLKDAPAPVQNKRSWWPWKKREPAITQTLEPAVEGSESLLTPANTSEEVSSPNHKKPSRKQRGKKPPTTKLSKRTVERPGEVPVVLDLQILMDIIDQQPVKK